MYTYDKLALANGLRIIFVDMPHVHSMVCTAYVGMGSRYEAPQQAGLSHLVEHMLFRGARSYDDSLGLLGAVDDIGGAADAFTSPEYSVFTLSVHPRHGCKAVQIMIDLILGGEFRQKDLDLEREIVLEEISAFRGSRGDYVCIDDMAYNLMWKRNGAGSTSFGTDRSIKSFTVGDLRRHYESFFVPEGTVICIAGRFDREVVEEMIAEAFGPLSGTKPEVNAEVSDEHDGPKSQFVRYPSQAVQVKLCHKAFSYRHPHFTAMLIIADVLGGGVSCRLMTNVRELAGLVYDITCAPMPFGDVGSLDIMTSMSKGNLVKTVRAVIDEIDRLTQDGITEQELRRTEERVFSHIHYVMDSTLDMANWFAEEELLNEPETPETPEVRAEKVRNVSCDEVLDVSRQIFKPSRRNLVALGPTGWWKRMQVRDMLQG